MVHVWNNKLRDVRGRKGGSTAHHPAYKNKGNYWKTQKENEKIATGEKRQSNYLWITGNCRFFGESIVKFYVLKCRKLRVLINVWHLFLRCLYSFSRKWVFFRTKFPIITNPRITKTDRGVNFAASDFRFLIKSGLNIAKDEKEDWGLVWRFFNFIAPRFCHIYRQRNRSCGEITPQKI